MPRNSLLPNYGWVQNTSNLSTIRDTIDLVPDAGIRHIDLRDKIRDFRVQNNDLPRRWTWDARCRIKAIHALGLVKLNRFIQGYDLTALGRDLKNTPKGTDFFRNHRVLTSQEIDILKKGLLTNPPVIRVLTLLNEDRLGENIGLSKYDIGSKLGFVGDVGFTHLDPFWVVANGYSFNDKEGDADKWARTILSWLSQVNWIYSDSRQNINGNSLKVYKVIDGIANVLRYDASRITRSVPCEMLCSNHHSFPKLIQKRRSLILQKLNNATTIEHIINFLDEHNIQINEKDVRFEIINLKTAGFRIDEDAGYYKLKDRIDLDFLDFETVEDNTNDMIGNKIEDFVVKYENTIPPKYVDHLIRFSSDSSKCNEFESIVYEYFRFLGYETDYYGQGRGRVTDVIAKFKNPNTYARSYAVIIDAKSTRTSYTFPVGDKRKMKEYIRTHGPSLLQEYIPNHAFSFISSNFIAQVQQHLCEIADETHINGCAITVDELLKLGDMVKKQEVSISDIYDRYTVNDNFCIIE